MTTQQLLTCRCGKDFLVYPYRLKEAKFCSRACSSKWKPTGHNKGKKLPNGSLAKMGSKNGMWNKTSSYSSTNSIHQWVARRLKKPLVCENCREDKKLELANMNDHIHRREVDDYKWICRRCHMIHDGRLKYLKLAPNHIKHSLKK